jgi:hypothetical protein
MKGWLVAVLVAMVVAVACQNESPSPPPNHSGGVWLRGSQPIDPDVARTGPGPAHCGDQDSIFLVIGWPLGTAERNTEVARWYVRNPSDFRKDSLLSDFAAEVIPPKDVRYTRYYNSSYELWLAPSDQDVAAYIKTGGHFERWPRAKQSLMCM